MASAVLTRSAALAGLVVACLGCPGAAAQPPVRLQRAEMGHPAEAVAPPRPPSPYWNTCAPPPIEVPVPALADPLPVCRVDPSFRYCGGEAAGGSRSMTEAATLGFEHLEAGRWLEAAQLFHAQSVGKPDDDVAAQPARLGLAVALYQLRLLQPSLDLLSRMVDQADPPPSELLPWFLVLAAEMPEAADVARQLARFTPDQIERVATSDRPGSWHARYLLGRRAYSERDLDSALAWWGPVPADAVDYARAQLFIGMTHVMLRKVVPAVAAFSNVIDATGTATGDESARLRALAQLSTARAFYSTAMRREAGETKVDDAKLRHALKYWALVDPQGDYGPDARRESSWAFFMAGDFAETLANIRILRERHGDCHPEADLLEASALAEQGHRQHAQDAARRMKRKYQPIRDGLRALAAERADEREGGLHAFHTAVVAGTADVEEPLGPYVAIALGDRTLLRAAERVRFLEAQQGLLAHMPKALGPGALAAELQGTLEQAAVLAKRRVAALVRARLLRLALDVDGLLGDADALVQSPPP